MNFDRICIIRFWRRLIEVCGVPRLANTLNQGGRLLDVVNLSRRPKFMANAGLLDVCFLFTLCGFSFKIVCFAILSNLPNTSVIHSLSRCCSCCCQCVMLCRRGKVRDVKFDEFKVRDSDNNNTNTAMIMR